jgi:HPt (histidine-containing phosphotransfer) domain-containing protein
MSDILPILDLPEALNRSLGDAEFLQMMMDEFQKSIPDFILRFETALHDQDMEALGRDAHQLKGASANLGAKSMAAIALELENIGKSGESATAAQALTRLKAEIEKFNRKLAEIDWTSL